MNKPTRSKINLAATILSGLTIALLVLDVGAELKSEILTFAGLTLGPMIIVFRTWFTGPKE